MLISYNLNNVFFLRVASMVSNKIQAIINCVATAEELPTVMLVQKGRYLIGQLITYSDDSQASEIMTTLVKITPRFAHRIPSDSVCTKLRVLIEQPFSEQPTTSTSSNFAYVEHGSGHV